MPISLDYQTTEKEQIEHHSFSDSVEKDTQDQMYESP